MSKKVEGFIYGYYTIYFKDGTSESVRLPVDATAWEEIEHGYGADADGNRGIDFTFYEDVEVEEEAVHDSIHQYIGLSLDWDTIATFVVDSVDEDSFQKYE